MKFPSSKDRWPAFDNADLMNKVVMPDGVLCGNALF